MASHTSSSCRPAPASVSQSAAIKCVPHYTQLHQVLSFRQVLARIKGSITIGQRLWPDARCTKLVCAGTCTVKHCAAHSFYGHRVASPSHLICRLQGSQGTVRHPVLWDSSFTFHPASPNVTFHPECREESGWELRAASCRATPEVEKGC